MFPTLPLNHILAALWLGFVHVCMLGCAGIEFLFYFFWGGREIIIWIYNF